MLENQKLLMRLSQSQNLLMSRNRSQIQKLLMSRIESQKWKSIIETNVDLLAESIMKLLSSLPAMMVFLSLRPPDVYDPLQIFLNEAALQEFGV